MKMTTAIGSAPALGIELLSLTLGKLTALATDPSGNVILSSTTSTTRAWGFRSE